QRAQSRGIPVRYLRRGDSFTIDDVVVEVLNPATWEPPERVSNDDSLTFRLRYGLVSFLLTGDIERRIESELSGWDCAALKADVLKVPHHGSRTASTDPFVACVDPRLAIISVGMDNPFGHPNAEVLNRYSARGVPAYETARHGAITVVTDGHTISTARWKLHP